MNQLPQKYWAFISYSHRDKAWGDWLHRGLERYKVPKALVGKETSRGEPVPARIFPVFRDREELPTAVDLGDVINHALEQSRYLIVICSPACAQSHWVNQEIIQFKRLGGENRVLAIIVDGEPNASVGKPGFTEDQECFPEALRYKLGDDGQLSKVPTEPIAADARAHADGKTNALLKLAAGVLGLNYDDLKRRDEAQRRKRQQTALATVSSIAVAISGLAITAWIQRKEAIRQKELANNFAREAGRQRDEAITQRRIAEFNLAQAELGQARHALADRDGLEAIRHALRAIDGAEAANRELEPAWQVLQRSLDLQSADVEWTAHQEEISSMFFDDAGERLVTSCSALGEVIVWSAANGQQLTRIACDGVLLAAWTQGGEEIVTLRKSDSGTELAWWDAATGVSKRQRIVPRSYPEDLMHYGFHENPTWISLAEFTDGDLGLLHLVRLSDGSFNCSIPGDKGHWLTDKTVHVVPAAEVALSASVNHGVQVFSLQTGKEKCRLAGIEPAEAIRVASLIPSTDGSAIAAVIRSNDGQIAAGVWRLSDGVRLLECPAEATEKLWLLASSGNRLIGPAWPWLEKIAASLGLSAVPVSMDTPPVAWCDDDPDAGSIAVSLDLSTPVELLYPDLGMSRRVSAIGDGTNYVTYAPRRRHLALANKAGGVKLLRLADSPVVREADLPPQVKPAAVAAGSNHMVMRTGERNMVTWDMASRRVVATMTDVPPEETAGEFSTAVDWNAVESWMAVTPPAAGESPKVATAFYDTNTGAKLGEYQLNPIWGVNLSPRKRRAIARLPDDLRNNVLWDLLAVEGGQLKVIPIKAEAMMPWFGPVFSPDGEKVFSSPRSGWLQEISTSTGLAQAPFKISDDQNWTWGQAPRFTIHPSGSHAIASTSNSGWKIDLATKAVLPIPLRKEAVFLGNGEIVAFEDGNRTYWSRWPEMTPMGNHNGSFDLSSSGVLGNNEALVLFDDEEGRLVVVSLEGGETLRTLEGVIGWDLSLGLAAVQHDTGVRVVRLGDGDVTAEIYNLAATGAYFAADGSRIGLVPQESQRFVSRSLRMNREAMREKARKLLH